MKKPTKKKLILSFAADAKMPQSSQFFQRKTFWFMHSYQKKGIFGASALPFSFYFPIISHFGGFYLMLVRSPLVQTQFPSCSWSVTPNQYEPLLFIFSTKNP